MLSVRLVAKPRLRQTSATASGLASRNACGVGHSLDRKSTRLNSSHANISYAVFCLQKKKASQPTIVHDSDSIVGLQQTIMPILPNTREARSDITLFIHRNGCGGYRHSFPPRRSSD